MERQQLREVRKNESRPQHKGEDRHAHLQHQQEDGRQQPSPKDTGLADAANGLAVICTVVVARHALDSPHCSIAGR